ncbi:MAG: SpaA isopeptide-forming pilin-related protein, partial [Nocardioidaceae bacterium]
DRVSGPIVVDAASAEEGGYPVTVISDPQIRSAIEVLKSDDETDDVLEGAEFQAYLDDGTAPGELDDSDTPLGGPVATGADGLTGWTGLLFGTYLVEEVAAPEGYDLPEETVQVVTIDAENAGRVVRLVFLDPAQGTLTTSKAAFELVRGEWVESDGLVEFGDQVRYVVTVTADGPRIHHAVTVSDYIPGNDPDDTTSDTEGRYLAGTAVCLEVGDCTVSFDAGEQLLTWELGDMRNQTRSVEFVIEFPPAGDESILVEGVHTETLANTAAVTWTDRDGDREIDSNQVVVDAELVVLGIEEERPPVKPRPPAVLPATGAPANTGLWTVLGGLLLTVGAALLFRRRRETP